MTDYLEDAATELRHARSANEARVGAVHAMHSGQQAEAAQIIREVNDRRMEIAAAFTRLAECQAAMLDAARMPGLSSCCHHAPPGQEPQP